MLVCCGQLNNLNICLRTIRVMGQCYITLESSSAEHHTVLASTVYICMAVLCPPKFKPYKPLLHPLPLVLMICQHQQTCRCHPLSPHPTKPDRSKHLSNNPPIHLNQCTECKIPQQRNQHVPILFHALWYTQFACLVPASYRKFLLSMHMAVLTTPQGCINTICQWV
jgi:hypothetical protein